MSIGDAPGHCRRGNWPAGNLAFATDRLGVNSTNWTGGPDNVAPIAALKQAVWQQAAMTGR
jgi:hypothetical protein